MESAEIDVDDITPQFNHRMETSYVQINETDLTVCIDLNRWK